MAAKGVAEPWTRPEFIDAVVSLQRIRELRSGCVTDVVQFHDRSAVCTAALADYLGFPRPQSLLQELERLKTQNIFQAKVVFLMNLGFITPTEARRISYEETVRFERIHERTYRDLGFEIAYIGAGSVLGRVRELKRTLSLGVLRMIALVQRQVRFRPNANLPGETRLTGLIRPNCRFADTPGVIIY